MDYHVLLAAIALVVAILSLMGALYSARFRRVENPLTMSTSERACFAWNKNYAVGTWIAYEQPGALPVDGLIAVRSQSKAYVQDGVAVVDVERFGAIPLDARVHAI